jgi:GNAT superfamily N-acetyltransferase
MLAESPFDAKFLRLPCYRLTEPVSGDDLKALAREIKDGPVFADVKLRAADLSATRMLQLFGFRRICVQVELRCVLERSRRDSFQSAAEGVAIADSLSLNPDDIESHAANFETNRYRQDPLLDCEAANRLYARWVANSLSGRRCVAHIARNFCSFLDAGEVRSIDLLSVLDKRQGHAMQLVHAVIEDARRKGLTEVRVVTEVENEIALSVYRRAGFEIRTFYTCLHLMRSATTA